MFKVTKETDDFVEGVGFIENVFEKIANKQSKKLHFKVDETNNKNKNEIVITITEPNVRKKQSKRK